MNSANLYLDYNRVSCTGAELEVNFGKTVVRHGSSFRHVNLYLDSDPLQVVCLDTWLNSANPWLGCEQFNVV